MNWKRGVLIIAGLLLASVLITCLSWIRADTPQKKVREELQAIKDNKLTEAYYAYTSKEFQAATSLDDFKKFLKSIPILAQPSSLDLETLPDLNDLKIVKVVVKGAEGNLVALHFQVIKQDNQWKILNIKAIPSSQEESPNFEAKHGDVLSTLNTFLNFLDEGKLDSAYRDLTSEGFKSTSTLTTFKEFVSQFPIFRNFIDFEVIDISENENALITKTKLRDPELITVVDFTFVQDADKWLIRGIQIASQTHTPNVVPDFDAAELTKPIKGQLQVIEKGLLKEAYHGFTAKAFQQTTSLEEFEKFIRNYPMFMQKHSTDFYKLTFNNNVGMYNVQLRNANGQSMELEYALMKENGQWKILQIQVFDKL